MAKDGGQKNLGAKNVLVDGGVEPLINTHETLIERPSNELNK